MTSTSHTMLIKQNLKQLRLPTIAAEFEKLGREADQENQSHPQYLLKLTELEVATRSTNALQARIHQAKFPLIKELDSFDFSAIPSLNRRKVLQLAQEAWLDANENVCWIGSAGTGKTHLAIATSLAACRLGKRVRFYTAANLVNRLEEAQKNYQIERLLAKLEKIDLLVIDELGYLSFSRAGAELLFQVIAERYERSSTMVTTNLPFGEWGQVFQGERMTAALLDRLTHRCHIFEINATSYRFKESLGRQQKQDQTQMK